MPVYNFTDLIIENSKTEDDFTQFFIRAAKSGTIEACNYFVDKKLK